MAKRYYFSPIEQVTDDLGVNYRPKIAAYGVPFAAVIPTGPDGKPLRDWALCIVGGNKHATIAKDGAHTPLPDFPLDGKMSAIQAATRNAMLNACARKGINTTALGNADGYRDAIRLIGQALDPAFTELAFDCADQ